MKRLLLVTALVLAFSVPAHAGQVYVGRLPWSQANVDALHGANLAAVVKFVNATQPADALGEIYPNQVVDFAWAKVGGGESDLVVALDFSGRGYYTLWIYTHGSGDMLAIQEIRGWKKSGGLNAMLQDLNGDGVDELILVKEIGNWTLTPTAPLWPEIYRPENGKYVEEISQLPGVRPGPHSVEIPTRYVEASRDFPSYYDTILSNLDQTITLLQQKAAQGEGDPGALAYAMVEKDKILRVLGRNPTAGLNHAYRWMNSSDPLVLQAALATFSDIGGHEQQVHAIKKALPGAVVRAIEASKGK